MLVVEHSSEDICEKAEHLLIMQNGKIDLGRQAAGLLQGYGFGDPKWHQTHHGFSHWLAVNGSWIDRREEIPDSEDAARLIHVV